MTWSLAIVASIAVVVAVGLQSRLGPGRALGCGLAAAMLTASAAGLLLMDLEALHERSLALSLGGAAVGWAALTGWLRRRWPPRAIEDDGRAVRIAGAGLLVVLVVGTGMRLDPSPYLHGGQDQGIYVNVGHHLARTGRLRPIDPIMAGRIPGLLAEEVWKAHRIAPVEEGSPLEGVREGRWIAGVHVEDASEGRLVPGFFHLLPVWFAMTELELGFSRSTWCLVLFAALSQLAAFAVGFRLGAGDGERVGDRRRGWAVGLIAAAALALHPLDLWISTFTVSEDLARVALLGAAALALEASVTERRGEPGAELMAGLSGLTFAAGVFTRGSMLALAIVLAGALVLCRSEAPRSRRVLLWTLVVGTTTAAAQAIVCSWPYFFSAASNHFHVPRIQPYKDEAVAWAVVAGAAVLGVDALWGRAQRRWPSLGRTDAVVRGLAVMMLLGAMVAATLRIIDATDAYEPSQSVTAVLLRYGGPVGPWVGLIALWSSPWRARPGTRPWVLLATAILVVTTLKEGVRYEFYYARYLVADALPVLLVAAAWGLGEGARIVAARLGPRVAAASLGVALVAWWGPTLPVLARPVFWTRDLAHGPEQLAAMLEPIPEGAVLFFDARAPGRWRGILATPTLLSFGQPVLVYPSRHMVERAVVSGTPVYMLSGGWEPDVHQQWPDHGPWHTTVVARGAYHARRAEVIEGDMPRALVEWGGPWELHLIDPSIWRGHGAFSLYPGSRFVVETKPEELRTIPIALRWETGARVELHVPRRALEGCTVTAALEGDRRVELERVSDPRGSVLTFALPEPSSQPMTASVVVRWTCAEGSDPLPWRRLSMRWERG